MDERVAEILERCYAAIQDGGDPDIEALCAHCPELLPRVRQLLGRERELVERTRAPEPANWIEMPRHVGDFTIIDVLGSGGMGTVYLARQESLQRDVALKLMHRDLGASPPLRLRFEREASIAAALDHPGIVPVYAAGDDRGVLYLAMKLLRGQSLERIPKPLEPKTVAEIGAAIADALHAAHEVGVLHRDIKPANIALENGEPVVLDFGLACLASSAGAITRPDQTPGTLAYMAPELLQNKDLSQNKGTTNFHPAIDVYALGATLYELLDGEPPHDHGHPVQMIQRVLHAEPRPLQVRRSDTELATVIHRAIERDPRARFPTAAEFRDDLRRFLDGIPVLSRKIGPLRRLGRMIQRHPLRSSLVGAAVLAAALAVYAFVDRAAERRARIAAFSEGVREALAVGDFMSAREAFDSLDSNTHEVHDATELSARIERQERLHHVLALLLTWDTHRDGQALHSAAKQLVQHAAAPDCGATLAIAHRVLADGSVQSPPPNFAAILPRTARAIARWDRIDDKDSPLPSSEPSGTPSGDETDHLLCAIVLDRSGSRPADTERELRMIATDGPRAGAVALALAAALEAQSAHRAAFDVCGRLLAHRPFVALAHAARARLASHVGWDRIARRELEAMESADSPSPNAELSLTRLQVLTDLGDAESFAAEWHAARNGTEHLARYWLLGGYSAVDLGELALAIERFDRGTRCNPDSTTERALRAARLEAEWQVRDTDTTSTAAVLDFAERALQFAAQHDEHLLASADARLVAVQSLFAAGEQERAFAVLDRLCVEPASAEALSYYAQLLGSAAIELSGAPNPRTAEDSLNALRPRLAVALERAREVERLHALGIAVPRYVRDLATIGRFLCAYVLCESDEAVRQGVGILRERERHDAYLPWVRAAMANGCVDLDCWARFGYAVDDRLFAALDKAHSALVAAAQGGELEREFVRGVFDRWRDHPLLEPVRDQEVWRGLWAWQ